MTNSDLPYVIAIGASGSEGMQDMGDLLNALPRPLTAIVMLVLHRPVDRISHLQSVLSHRCSLPVVVASEAERLEAGTCYIGEPDKHLTLMAQDEAGLITVAGNALRNRTINALFDTLATFAGVRAIGIVLSGSLDDGSEGLEKIHHSGGFTMVLDPGGKPRGMQQNAIDYDGPISFIGTAEEMGQVLGEITTLPRSERRRL
jgi:two-component system chemotaxis response regulator CheB